MWVMGLVDNTACRITVLICNVVFVVYYVWHVVVIVDIINTRVCLRKEIEFWIVRRVVDSC